MEDPQVYRYRYRGTDARGDGHYGTWTGTLASLEANVNKWYRQGWRSLAVVTGDGPVPPGPAEQATVAGIGRWPGERARHCWYEAP